MRKLSRLVAVAALVAIVGTTAALAYGPFLSYAQRFNEVKGMRIYDRNLILRGDEGAGLAQMPMPSNDSQMPSITELMGMRDEVAALNGGPVDASRFSGSAIPGRSGMAMLSPRERTEQEVRRLTRALD